MAKDLFWILSSIGVVFIVLATIRLLLRQITMRTFSIIFITGEMFILSYFIKELIDEVSIPNIFTFIVVILGIITSIVVCLKVKTIR